MSKEIEMIVVKDTQVPIIYEKSEYLPMVSMQIVFGKSGSIYESKEGLAEISANLLNEGTKKEGSVVFATKLENSAIGLSSSVSSESFTIEMSSLKEQFDKGVLLLQELLQDPNYTQESLQLVKKQKIGWLTQHMSDFDYIASLGLKKTLFAGTPLGKPKDGTIESVEGMQLTDIQKFIASHLGYNNATVVIGGDIDSLVAKESATKILNLLPKVTLKESAFIDPSSDQNTTIAKEDTQQAYIYFGAPYSFKYSDDNQHISMVASFVLGGSGFGSRLMEEIRVKRGLAYSAYSKFVIQKNTSYLSGYLQTKLENEQEAKALVKNIIEEFVAKGITQEELDSAKKFLIGSEPLRNETLSQRLSQKYSEYYFNRPIGFQKKQLELIEKLTLQEVNDFIKSHPEIAKLSFSIVTAKK